MNILTRRLLIFLSGLLGFLCLIVGCSDKEEQKPLSPAVKIGVCLADLRGDGNQVIKKVLDKRKDKEQAEIIWLDARNDFKQQEKQIAELIKRRVKVIIWQPVEAEKCSSLVQKIKQKNIRLVVINNLPVDAPADACVTFDHARVGQLLGRFVDEALTALPQDRLSIRHPLNVLILKGPAKDKTAAEIAGALYTYLRGNSKVRLLAEEEFTAADINQDGPKIQPRLEPKINQTDVIIATDSRLTEAAVASLKTRGLAGQVLTAGVGASLKASQTIFKGEHEAEVDLMPELVAQCAFDAALNLAKTGYWPYTTQVVNGNYNIPAQITPVRLINRENLYLLEERWGKELKKEAKESEKGNQKGPVKEGEGQKSSSPDKGEGDLKPKTTLRITTQEGKTVEVQIPGEVKSIETKESAKK
ncbi:MAG TPA: sugar ABC transporter substrate-binding protein [Desulfotomaculum sp.]|nr:sugar ABC transporter substrate-binding protein [Desulfotomaculum sp.]